MQMTFEEACYSFYEDIIKYCYYRTSKNKPDTHLITNPAFLTELSLTQTEISMALPPS